MRIPESVDVLVIGAGPAGCAAAIAAGSRGVRTMLVDRKTRPGVPVRCGEYVPLLLRGEWNLPDEAAARRTESLFLTLPDGSEREIRAPGIVLNRDIMNDVLVKRAEDSYVVLCRGCKFMNFEEPGIALIRSDREYRVRCRIIIAADGARSRVARCSGLELPVSYMAMQEVVEMENPVESARIYFYSRMRMGYGWLFPKGNHANMGVAADFKSAGPMRNSLAMFKDHMSRLKLINPSSRSGRIAGLVPAHGPVEIMGRDNILLAGDAAGQVDPVTGAGIMHALRSGDLAGTVAADSVNSGNENQAGQIYEKKWKKLCGGYFERAVKRRTELDKSWNEDLNNAILKAWKLKA